MNDQINVRALRNARNDLVKNIENHISEELNTFVKTTGMKISGISVVVHEVSVVGSIPRYEIEVTIPMEL